MGNQLVPQRRDGYHREAGSTGSYYIFAFDPTGVEFWERGEDNETFWRENRQVEANGREIVSVLSGEKKPSSYEFVLNQVTLAFSRDENVLTAGEYVLFDGVFQLSREPGRWMLTALRYNMTADELAEEAADPDGPAPDYLLAPEDMHHFHHQRAGGVMREYHVIERVDNQWQQPRLDAAAFGRLVSAYQPLLPRVDGIRAQHSSLNPECTGPTGPYVRCRHTPINQGWSLENCDDALPLVQMGRSMVRTVLGYNIDDDERNHPLDMSWNVLNQKILTNNPTVPGEYVVFDGVAQLTRAHPCLWMLSAVRMKANHDDTGDREYHFILDSVNTEAAYDAIQAFIHRQNGRN